ncbi:protein IQ-DOMAIN 9 isoform X3 [Diospyros lotus]|uniref:protein IQ-DOMAIN 9 isoform X3 n=1 Tax=Diospyros lotus TaxID=55363 RepID=UPI002253ABAD|nr:protein IQ-DOMAIN 9 isoform X3 [Diospyros lotus]
MGSGDWFKNIISSKKAKDKRLKQSKGSSATEKSNGVKHRTHSHKVSTKFANNAAKRNPRFLGMEVEDIAATKIQTAFRAYMARKKLRRLKGIFRLQILTQSQSVSKQASTTLSHLHSWSRIQGQIRARRVAMVTEGRIRQKKLENQLKLEAKLHDLEVEWNGGSETMEEILGRIHQREEAAGKRERALAYAFSHQASIFCSGEPTPTQSLALLNLAKLTGVGAGWNAGSQPDHGKAGPLSSRAPKNHLVGLATKLVKAQAHLP